MLQAPQVSQHEDHRSSMVKLIERHPVHDHGVQGGVAVLIGAAAIANREVALLLLAHGASLLTSGDLIIGKYL